MAYDQADEHIRPMVIPCTHPACLGCDRCLGSLPYPQRDKNDNFIVDYGMQHPPTAVNNNHQHTQQPVEDLLLQVNPVDMPPQAHLSQATATSPNTHTFSSYPHLPNTSHHHLPSHTLGSLQMDGSSPSPTQTLDPTYTLGPSPTPLPSSMSGSWHQLESSSSQEYEPSGMYGSSHLLEPSDAFPSDLHTLEGPHTYQSAQDFQFAREFVAWNTVGTSPDPSTLPNSITTTAYDDPIVAANLNLPLENDLRLVDPRLAGPTQVNVAASRHETATTSSDTASPSTTTSPSRYQCDDCLFSYETQGQLQRHRSEKHQAYTAKGKVQQQNKSQLRPYKCKIEGCPKDFPKQWKLNAHHRNIHNPESKHNKLKNQKDVPCHGCGRIWGTGLSLRDHHSRSPSCRVQQDGDGSGQGRQ
ncbi:hypothetical protein PG985_003744 [Apiospora marii]|uniref:C2H2-type domain-containing protein n=1 Tax=Apiospora marii TaxID=335849 RepID=A0ABR1SIX7_9PEZI